MSLYPLKFTPILKERIWGGKKLSTKLNKSTKSKKIGESWELSAYVGDESVVCNGYLAGNTLTELVEVYMGDLVGEGVYKQYGLNFPLLFKIIDAAENLSIQVHPGDAIASVRHNSFGKTEMWYVMEAEPNAELIVGLKFGITPEKYTEALEKNKIENILKRIAVSKGDVFFLPAGQVHAIGSGILLAEIQQTSDITYRIFDYNRLDDKGSARQLHVKEAFDVIDFNYSSEPKILYQDKLNGIVPLVSCEYFTTNLIKFDNQIIRNYGDIDSFKVYMCTEGAFQILFDGNYTSVATGETILIPASIGEVIFIPDKCVTLIEVFSGKINKEISS